MRGRFWVQPVRLLRTRTGRPHVRLRLSGMVRCALLVLVAVAIIVSLPSVRDGSVWRQGPPPTPIGRIEPEGDLFAAVLDVERQPLLAQVSRLRLALQELGAPWPRDVDAQIELAEQEPDDARAVRMIQTALDPLCVAAVRITGDGDLSAAAAPREIGLDEHGTRVYLVKVHNPAGVGTNLKILSPQAESLPGETESRWLEIRSCEERPLCANLSGLALEYRAVQFGSIAAGKRLATLMFGLGVWPDGSHQPRADDGAVRTWRFEHGLDGWVSSDPSAVDNRDGHIQVQSATDGPVLSAMVDLPVKSIEARVVARTRYEVLARWFWRTRNEQIQLVSLDLENDGKWHEYKFRSAVHSALSEVRLMLSGAPGPVEIRSISLCASERSSGKLAIISSRFDVRPAREIKLDLKDEAGQPTTAALEIIDDHGHVYPARGMRLAPDFFFQKQIYRADGETLRLPTGRYRVRFSRGPESIPEHRVVTIGDMTHQQPLSFRVKRWVDPAKLGWWSGDHHIHAAGCRHFDSPTQGVQPADIMRHCLGEDLKVGDCLTWGPCFEYQSQFFTGQADRVSRPPYLLRYDVEVSGFGSHQSGHLCLLGLKSMEYPGSAGPLTGWPTLGLDAVRWAKARGAVVGSAHSSSGLIGSVGRVGGTDGPDHLPDFTIPPFNGIGANEFIVDVTHEVPGADGRLVPAIDFLSTMDSDPRLELNIWYHVLNCGLRPRIAGETDFPCFSGQRIGMGRTYVKVDGTLTDDAWLRGLRNGRSYVSNGTCHLMDFRVEPVERAQGRQPLVVNVGDSELRLEPPAEVLARVKVVGVPAEGSPKSLKVETVLNGYPHSFQQVPQDGSARDLVFKVPVSCSSWLAIRVFPSAHTNPIFLSVRGRPVRASRRSAEWCLRGVDQCWHEKEQFYHSKEIGAARKAYEHARSFYQRVRDESPVD
jgi:hypothetical protein